MPAIAAGLAFSQTSIGKSIVGGISNFVGGLFGKDNFREGQNECVPCGGFKNAELLYNAALIDKEFEKLMRGIFVNALAVENINASALPVGCNDITTLEKLVVAFEFLANGARDCKSKGASEKIIAREFPRIIDEANAIMARNASDLSDERLGGPVTGGNNSRVNSNIFSTDDNLGQSRNTGIAGGLNTGNSAGFSISPQILLGIVAIIIAAIYFTR